MSQKSKFWQWIDHRVRVTIQDQRMLVGTFIGFDKHLNCVLADTEEFRRLKPKNPGDPEREIKRPLGLLMLRGDNIVSISAEKAPQQKFDKKSQMNIMGPGKSAPFVRPGNVNTKNGNLINQHGQMNQGVKGLGVIPSNNCLLYTSPSPRD